MKPKRIQLRRTRGWRIPPNTIIVDRRTPWGNPFKVTKARTQKKAVVHFTAMIHGICLLFQKEPTLLAQIKYRKKVKEEIGQLRGKNLACWCKLGTPCHADVLLKIANRKGTP